MKTFIAANVVDAISTLRSLPYGGIEGNPVIAGAVHAIGLEATLILKVVAAIAFGLSLMKFGKVSWLKWPTAVIAIAAISNSILPHLM